MNDTILDAKEMEPTPKYAILRNVLAVVLGWGLGSMVNMKFVEIGLAKYPITGIDNTDMEAVVNAIPTLSTEHFIYPFLAHALGTFIGAYFAARIAATHKMKFAYAIGGLFMLGGLVMAFMTKGPMWFIALDLLFAYIPMAWMAGKLATSFKRRK